ncbi:UNVERIFIED_CONTAM: hypothetical protein FKN15_019866 [Acipenser sinensis]
MDSRQGEEGGCWDALKKVVALYSGQVNPCNRSALLALGNAKGSLPSQMEGKPRSATPYPSKQARGIIRKNGPRSEERESSARNNKEKESNQDKVGHSDKKMKLRIVGFAEKAMLKERVELMKKTMDWLSERYNGAVSADWPQEDILSIAATEEVDKQELAYLSEDRVQQHLPCG